MRGCSVASKRRLRRRQCRRKTRYSSKQEARQAGLRPSLVIYKCPFCTGYHAGHKPRRRV